MRFYCEDCVREHAPQERQAIIRRMGDVTYGEVRAAYESHPWPPTEAGERMLYRDMRAVRGRPKDSAEGQKRRLEQFLELVLDRGLGAIKASILVHMDEKRGRKALHAMGYRYVNRGKWGQDSGWFRKRRAA